MRVKIKVLPAGRELSCDTIIFLSCTSDQLVHTLTYLYMKYPAATIRVSVTHENSN